MPTVGPSFEIPEALEEAVIPQQVRLAESDGDLSEICLRVCRLTGFSHYCIVRRVDADPDASGWSVLLSNWPAGLTDSLTALLLDQPAGRIIPALNAAGPFCLTLSRPDDPKTFRLFEAGLKYNLLFNVHRGVSSNGIVCFSGDRHGASEMELMSLQFHAMLIHDRLAELASRGETKKGAEVSPRELECLRWIAKGKTSSEIGIILGLSENTINNYIVNACRKIGAVNRIHAVYLALKMGLIS